MTETAGVPLTFHFQNLTSQMEAVKIPKETMKNPAWSTVGREWTPVGVARRGRSLSRLHMAEWITSWALREHLRVRYLAHGRLGSGLRVSWHLSLRLEHLPCLLLWQRRLKPSVSDPEKLFSPHSLFQVLSRLYLSHTHIIHALKE